MATDSRMTTVQHSLLTELTEDVRESRVNYHCILLSYIIQYFIASHQQLHHYHARQRSGESKAVFLLLSRRVCV